MQQYKHSDHCFNIQANTFELKVTKGENKLVITLQDYIDWIIYEKEYTDDKYKQEIHKKVDLQDIYFSLTNAVQKDKKTESNKTSQRKNLLEYNFNDTVTRKQIPYFKIQSNGMITVYVCILDKRKSQQVVYQSHLKLKKQREMTQIQILKIQFFLEKWYLLKVKQQLCNKIQAFENQRSEMSNKLLTHQKCQQSLKKLQNNEKLIKTLEREKQELVKKLVQAQKNCNLKQEISSTKKQRDKYKNLHNQAMSFLQGFSLVKSFYEGYQGYINFKTIPYHYQYNFRVKIINIPKKSNPYIGIGIFNITKNTKPSYFYNSGYVGAYYCWEPNKGITYPSQTTQGPGYKQNQIINVYVNLKAGSVRWVCQGNNLATISNEYFKDESFKFVPYVEVYYKDTSFQWLI